MLYDLLRGEAAAHHLYDMRRGPQAVMLVLLSGLMLLAIGFGLRQFHGRAGAWLAFTGAMLSVGIWCSEIISLHAMDAFLYHPIGPEMVINFLWLAACTMTSVGILADAARGKAHPG